MGSLIDDEECQFFDASEDIASISDASPESNDIYSCYSGGNMLGSSFQYDVWLRSPKSVQERRTKFLDWMTKSVDRASSYSFVDVSKLQGEFDRINESSEAVLRTYGFEEEFRSSRSSMSCWSNDNLDLLEEKFVCRDGNLGGGMAGDGDEIGQDGQTSDGQEMNTENNCGSLCSFHQLVEDDAEKTDNSVGMVKTVKKGWLNRLLSFSCAMDNQGEAEKLSPNKDDAILWSRVQRVKVRQCKKSSKELSALYKGQEIRAHEGSILTMKFSPDGQYLASAGEDGVVRLWQVVVEERLNEQDIPEIDPSCVYFTVNHLSKLKPLFTDKEKMNISRALRRTSDSACVIFPPKVFRILEKPLHEFHGHSSEILDLSWSKNNVCYFFEEHLI